MNYIDENCVMTTEIYYDICSYWGKKVLLVTVRNHHDETNRNIFYAGEYEIRFVGHDISLFPADFVYEEDLNLEEFYMYARVCSWNGLDADGLFEFNIEGEQDEEPMLGLLSITKTHNALLKLIEKGMVVVRS